MAAAAILENQKIAVFHNGLTDLRGTAAMAPMEPWLTQKLAQRRLIIKFAFFTRMLRFDQSLLDLFNLVDLRFILMLMRESLIII